MVFSFLIAILSGALFLFYVQSICERVLQREFSQPYFENVLKAMHLEYPSVIEALSSGTSPDYSSVRLGLECDFEALSSLLKYGVQTRRFLSRRERLLLLYFRFLLLCLPIRHVLNLREEETVMKLSTMLQFFANVVGERLTVTSLGIPSA